MIAGVPYTGFEYRSAADNAQNRRLVESVETVCSRTVSKIPILQLFPKFECVDSFIASLIEYFDVFKIRLLLSNKFASSENKTRSITIAVYCLECVNT